MSAQGSPISTSAKPRQKRYHRRSARACDECRLRKCKCDGQSPCGPCKVTGNECTYDPKPIPVQKPTLKVRELEARFRSVRAVVQDLRSKARRDGLNGSEPELRSLEDYLGISSPLQSSPSVQEFTPRSEDEDHTQSKSMMGNTGRFVTSDSSRSTFYGKMSGFNFICRTLELFQHAAANAESISDAHTIICNVFDAVTPEKRKLPTLFGNDTVLPDWHVTMEQVDSAFEHCRTLSRLFHLEEFRGFVGLLYDPKTAQNVKLFSQLTRLLHAVLALGAFFDRPRHRQRGCAEIVGEATTHFLIATADFDMHEAPTLLRLKVLLCFIIFLVSSSRMGKAHSYLGLACSAALRLGLNRVKKSDDQEKQVSEESVVLSLLLEYDIYMSIVLDIPQLMNLDSTTLNIFLPAGSEVTSSLSTPPDPSSAGTTSEIELSQAHLQLLLLLSNSLKSIFHDQDIYSHPGGGNGMNIIDDKLVKEADADFERWMKQVSPLLARSRNIPEYKNIRFTLETTFILSQLLLHLPFLHYLTPSSSNRSVTVTQSQIALSCIKTASDTILKFSKLYESKGYVATTWSTVYIIFISVVCLMFLIAAHEGTSHPGEAWKRAECGIRLLMSIQCVDNGANACLEVIKLLISRLKHTVDFDMVRIEATVQRICGTTVSTASTPIPSTLSHHHSHPYQHQRHQQQHTPASLPSPTTRLNQGPFSVHDLLIHDQSTVPTPTTTPISFLPPHQLAFPAQIQSQLQSQTHFAQSSASTPSPISNSTVTTKPSGLNPNAIQTQNQRIHSPFGPQIYRPAGSGLNSNMNMSMSMSMNMNQPRSIIVNAPSMPLNADDVLAKAQQSSRAVDFDMFLNFE